MAAYSKRLSRFGYVGVALNGISSTSKIVEACSTGSEIDCVKEKYIEGGRFAGSTLGAAGGGFVASWATCTVAFGLPSGGTSALWCGIVAGGAGGLVGGEFFGNQGKEWSEKLYETTN